MKKILLSILTIGLVSSVAFGATQALYSDTEMAVGTFSAGTLNLQVGDADPYIWNFSESNMKPGDNFNHDISIKNTGNIDGDAYIDIAVSNNLEGSNPESEGNTTPPGDLDKQVKIVIYMQEDSGSGGFANIGLVTTATVRIPIFLAIWAITGAAPVQVPPPSPPVIKIISLPRINFSISSFDSSAAWRPISGLPPAPNPRVSFSPI